MRCRAIVLAGAVLVLAGCARGLKETWQTTPPRRGSEVVVAVVAAQNPDPYAAGRQAAQALKDKFLGGPKVVLISECYLGRKNKERLLRGIRSVLPREILFGGATYGSITIDGCYDRDAVALLGLAGDGVGVRAALERELGASGPWTEDASDPLARRLRAAGARLARKIPTSASDRLLVVVADAHSPKNGPLVQGIQDVLGLRFPIIGGSVNKNAGQSYVYYQGEMFSDAAVALMLSGAFNVSLAGRQAKEAKAVVATAEAATAIAHQHLKGSPTLALIFDCAGRKGKLDRPADEIVPIKRVLKRDVPLFGCYCAGEIGPADTSDASPNVLSHGVGWHIMIALLGR